MNMVNTGRGPLGLKAEKPAKKPRKGMRRVSRKRAAHRASEAGQADLDHMGKVALLQCRICLHFGMTQNSPTEVHHCKSGRFSTARENDRFTIPLCHSHHNKLKPFPGDEDKIGYHNGQETWEARYGVDYHYIDGTLDEVDRLA